MDSVIEQKSKEIAFSRAEMLESFLRAFIAAKHPEVDTMEKAKEEMKNYILEETRHSMDDDFALKTTWRIVHRNTIQVPRELWDKVKDDIEFYASVNRADDPGSWDMRKRFVFDLIRTDDLDSAGYEDQPKGKYYFGGKRARSSLEAIKKAGL